jgi:hypothetical protein
MRNSPLHQRNRASGVGIQAPTAHRTIATLSTRTSRFQYRANHSTLIAAHLYVPRHSQLLSSFQKHGISVSHNKQDICARSPIAHPEALPSRTSLDSRFSRSTGMCSGRFEKPDAMEEEKFEEVGLNDETKPPKKKGIFARFGDSSDTPQSSNKSTSFGFHIPGRKRGQSGGGSELCAMKGPTPVVVEDGE